MMKLGLIGYGTIGRAVAHAVNTGRAGACELAAVLVRDRGRVPSVDSEQPDCLVTADLDDFLAADSDVVAEVAGHAALRLYAVPVLRSGRDLITVSVGALADEELLAAVRTAAAQGHSRLLIPSGAIAALDAVSSAAIGKIDEVTLLVRKPPAAWKGTPAEEAASRVAGESVCVYEGGVREAAGLFPQNVNVASALSLAGIGFDRTRIRICADPTISHNTFELIVRGDFGELSLELKNRPYPENPKTGYLVVMSVIKAIRRIQERIVVGY
ncbi:MAG: aspartate dehydrogenase [Acidobacteria bacterium]|nr:aspartate dehydrogenase [Acidobacteriota bacterium]